MILEQIAATPPVVDHAKEVYGLVAIFLTQIGLFMTSRHSGNKKDRAAGAELSRQLKPIHDGINECRGDIKDLKAHVVGPDGKNGLRSDVQEIKARVIGLEDRERDRLHAPYDRRS